MSAIILINTSFYCNHFLDLAALHLDSFDHQPQLGPAYHRRVAAELGRGQTCLFQSLIVLIVQYKPARLPVQQFDVDSLTVEIYKNCSNGRILDQFLPHQSGEIDKVFFIYFIRSDKNSSGVSCQFDVWLSSNSLSQIAFNRFLYHRHHFIHAGSEHIVTNIGKAFNNKSIPYNLQLCFVEPDHPGIAIGPNIIKPHPVTQMLNSYGKLPISFKINDLYLNEYLYKI